MNKIMTSALLLAAGTALSDAATLLDTNFGAYSNWDAATADGWSESTRRQAAFEITTVNLDASTPAQGLTVSAGWKQNSCWKTLGGEGIDLSSDGLYSITYEVWSNTENKVMQFSLANDSFSLVIGTSYTSNSGIYFGTVDANVLSGSTWYSFQTTDTETGNTQIPSYETLVDSNPSKWGLRFTISLETHATEADKLVVGITDANDATAVVLSNKEVSFDGNGILNTAGFMIDSNPKVAVVSSVSISSIPEPSAFGLIAGAGALALVASRRRRSK